MEHQKQKGNFVIRSVNDYMIEIDDEGMNEFYLYYLSYSKVRNE